MRDSNPHCPVTRKPNHPHFLPSQRAPSALPRCGRSVDDSFYSQGALHLGRFHRLPAYFELMGLFRSVGTYARLPTLRWDIVAV